MEKNEIYSLTSLYAKVCDQRDLLKESIDTFLENAFAKQQKYSIIDDSVAERFDTRDIEEPISIELFYNNGSSEYTIDLTITSVYYNGEIYCLSGYNTSSNIDEFVSCEEIICVNILQLLCIAKFINYCIEHSK